MPIDNLDTPCNVCDRPAGDHTLREWATCLGTPTVDLPMEAIPEDQAHLVTRAVRERFLLDDDLIIADHVTIISATLAGSTGVVGIKIPALIHEFQMGLGGRAPATVAKVAYLGDPRQMRAYGRLARDSANAAANKAEL